jgi:hypothetical protein
MCSNAASSKPQFLHQNVLSSCERWHPVASLLCKPNTTPRWGWHSGRAPSGLAARRVMVPPDGTSEIMLTKLAGLEGRTSVHMEPRDPPLAVETNTGDPGSNLNGPFRILGITSSKGCWYRNTRESSENRTISSVGPSVHGCLGSWHNPLVTLHRCAWACSDSQWVLHGSLSYHWVTILHQRGVMGHHRMVKLVQHDADF